MEVTATKGQIIKGKPVADQISENLIKEVDELVKEGINPKLAIVRVGARGDDLAYERGALKKEMSNYRYRNWSCRISRRYNTRRLWKNFKKLKWK